MRHKHVKGTDAKAVRRALLIARLKAYVAEDLQLQAVGDYVGTRCLEWRWLRRKGRRSTRLLFFEFLHFALEFANTVQQLLVDVVLAAWTCWSLTPTLLTARHRMEQTAIL